MIINVKDVTTALAKNGWDIIRVKGSETFGHGSIIIMIYFYFIFIFILDIVNY
jgi:hypothetical protein